MTEEQKVEAVNFWQDKVAFHQLTCRAGDCRQDLRGEMYDKTAVMVCPECGRVQDWIPEVVLATYQAHLDGKPIQTYESMSRCGFKV